MQSNWGRGVCRLLRSRGDGEPGTVHSLSSCCSFNCQQSWTSEDGRTGAFAFQVGVPGKGKCFFSLPGGAVLFAPRSQRDLPLSSKLVLPSFKAHHQLSASDGQNLALLLPGPACTFWPPRHYQAPAAQPAPLCSSEALPLAAFVGTPAASLLQPGPRALPRPSVLPLLPADDSPLRCDKPPSPAQSRHA